MGVRMVSKSICSLLVRLTQRDMLSVYTNLAWGGEQEDRAGSRHPFCAM